jgi:hypothetical protein
MNPLWTTLLLATMLRPEGAAPPFRQPQPAAGHGRVAMTFGAGSSIYFAASVDGGRSFLPPVKVAEVGALALGRHRGPRLAILRDSMAISAVVGERAATGAHAHGLPEAGDLAVWRSVDGGKSWTRAGVINDVPGAAREGLHAMIALPGDGLYAVWLDLRAQGTRLYGARSSDGGRTWTKNTLVYASPDGTICQCCHPSLALAGDGRIWAMWRNALGGARDLYAASSADGVRFDGARRLGEGEWKLNACPMDGGGFAIAADGPVSAWRREGDLYLAEPGRPEQRIGTGKDVALARTARGVWTAWTSKTGAIEARRPGAATQTLAAEGAFVSLTPLPGGNVLAAWERSGAIETAILD